MTNEESAEQAAKGWPDLPREFTDPAEGKRVERWHATYNAALAMPGIQRGSGASLADYLEVVHNAAVSIAEGLHGELDAD